MVQFRQSDSAGFAPTKGKTSGTRVQPMAESVSTGTLNRRTGQIFFGFTI